ncbi:MAG: metal-sulfur cluster assembly factor [Puniceicoccales bacterium]|jgi:metal-sulfur cluster biosynthetic enzyme|nr:metal-sulfur cluster assembly factor [Puniceicoccales bacterium]
MMNDCEFLWQQLKTVDDPDVHVNIVDLGLVYAIETKLNEGEEIHVTMTLTSPSCPMGDFLIDAVRKTLVAVCPHQTIKVELVWDPPWNPDMISEIGKMELGLL